jgi:hypothetical protein
MVRTLPILAAAVVLVSTGLVHGVWTDRWKKSGALERAVARLDRVPLVIGDWQGQPDELDRDQLEAAEIAGHLLRRYENKRTGDKVTVLVVCGRPGPISVHSPDICYRGAGYEVVERAKYASPEGAGSPAAEFFAGRFHKEQPGGVSNLRILWAWTADGDWKAPDGDPRLRFARAPALYKLYLIRDMRSPDEPLADDAAGRFAGRLLPELNRALFTES